MRVRRLDENHDWVFGVGRSSYERGSNAIAQCVKTRLLSLRNDWFLNTGHGITWFDYLRKNPDLRTMEIELKSAVLKTEGVTELTGFDININPNTRKCIIQVTYVDKYNNNSEVLVNAPGNE